MIMSNVLKCCCGPATLAATRSTTRATSLLVIAATTAVNMASYAAWTLTNKSLFTGSNSGDGDGKTTAVGPLTCTVLQMFITTVLAWFFVVILGIQRSQATASIFPCWSTTTTTAKPTLPSSSSTPNPPSSATIHFWLRRILPLGMARAVDIGCGNVALALVTVAVQQLVKATLPLFVTVLSVVFLKKRVTTAVMVAMIPIVLGTAVGSMRGGGGGGSGGGRGVGRGGVSGLGFLLALASCFGRASKAIINAAVLRGGGGADMTSTGGGGGGGARPLEVVLLEAPTTGLLLLLPALFFESRGLSSLSLLPSSSSSEPMDPTARHDWMVMNLFCGVMMFVTQASYVTLIDLTDPITCQVLMSIKMLLLVFTSLYWSGGIGAFSVFNVCGVLLAGTGCFLYASAMRAQQRAEQLAKKARDEV